ncbi:MAG TPA: hypothetical protein VGJ20_12870 [Xanthobacteraceae bacterium]|jgi:hypothetical protein
MEKIFVAVAFATLALSAAVPAQARSLSQVQEGDYYAPSHTIVQQPTTQELNEAKEGDFYPPSETIVQQPSARELNRAEHGDFYWPMKGN